MYHLYLITNQVTQKVYVGQTKQLLLRRWRTHVREARKGTDIYFARALRKYGEQAFAKEVVATVETKHEANELEKFLILVFRSYDSEFGYNSTFGGDGGFLIPSIKAKQSAAAAKWAAEWWTPERRVAVGASRRGKLIGPKNPMYGKQHWLGKKHSAETKERISLIRKEKYSDPEFKQRMSTANTGKHHTAAGRANIAKALVGNQYRKGIPHSQEVKDRIRTSMILAHQKRKASQVVTLTTA